MDWVTLNLLEKNRNDKRIISTTAPSQFTAFYSMFGSAVARKELNICLRCEYLLFRASHPYSIYRSSRLRRFTTTSRRIESENLSNNGGTANISINPERSYESRAALRDDLAPPDRANRILQTDSLRLNIPDDGLEQKFGERRNDRRSNVRYLAKSQYTDQSGTEGIHEVPIKEDPLQDLFRENYKYPAFRHPDVTSDRVELGVDRLGEPATIRVLPEKRDRARRTRENLPARIEEEGSKSRRKREAPTSFDEIAKALDLENEGAAGAAESMNNLETIRKAFQDTNNQFDGPTQAECLKLARLLDNGFTAAQLSGYRKLAKAMKHTEQNRLDAFTTNDRYSISRWYVGTCEWPKQSLRRLDPKICEHEQNVYAVLSSPTLDANGIPKQNSKQKLINSILSRHWGVRPLEERSREGSVSMNIGKNWLALLLGQSKSLRTEKQKVFPLT